MTNGSALEGLRILDLTRMLAGPYCTALLADMGADVIKVERPGVGDDARHFAPYKGGESGYFMLLNRGKKSITLNMKSPAGMEVLHRLIGESDVLIENFTPGVTRKLGIDYDSLKEKYPRLVYASISGFGQDGPLAHRAAYDIIAQAMSGLMSVTGAPDGPPTRVGESLGDLVAGLYTAWGIMVALTARDRTGRGQNVDVAMMDGLFSFLVTPMTLYLFGDKTPTRVGNRHPISTPFDTYRANDGHVVIAVANDPMFRRLAEAMEMPELADDPRFVTDEERTNHEPQLRALIEEWTGARTVAGVVEILEAAGVPTGDIWTIPEAATSAHVKHRGMLTEVEHPTAGRIPLLAQPVRLSETAGGIQGPPPLLGEHTETILSELLGMDEDAIQGLRRDGAI